MRDIQASNKRMTELLKSIATAEGIEPSILDGVKLMRATTPLPRMPVLYEPSIIIVGQGRKRGYLGGRVFTYDAHNYLVLSAPMPFECETEVGPDGPLLAVCIHIDLAVLGELIMKMDCKPLAAGAYEAHCVYSTPLDLALSEAAVRLLEALATPVDAQVLGPGIIREITYRVLCGKHANSLRALIAASGHLSQIQHALERIHANYAREIDVPTLANEAGMSVSAFHHNFKTITATSPLQYLKTIRLHKARMLMVQEGLGAGVAAERVGYESTSQFSREFKRFFGATPVDAAAQLREWLGLDSPAPTELQ